MNIAVIGPGSTATSEDLRLAHEVGRLIAVEGWVLLTGGLGGVMEEASIAARDAGGLTVGLLPGEDPNEANRSVMVPIPSGLQELRNGLLVRAAGAVVAIGGSWGTLSEIAFAMRTAKVLVQLGGWHVLDEANRELPGIFKTLEPTTAIAHLKQVLAS